MEAVLTMQRVYRVTELLQELNYTMLSTSRALCLSNKIQFTRFNALTA